MDATSAAAHKAHDAALRVPAFFNSGVGIYPADNFIHVDVGRGAPLRWVRVGGVYTYWS